MSRPAHGVLGHVASRHSLGKRRQTVGDEGFHLADAVEMNVMKIGKGVGDHFFSVPDDRRRVEVFLKGFLETEDCLVAQRRKGTGRNAAHINRHIFNAVHLRCPATDKEVGHARRDPHLGEVDRIVLFCQSAKFLQQNLVGNGADIADRLSPGNGHRGRLHRHMAGKGQADKIGPFN